MWRNSKFAVILISALLILNACGSLRDREDDGIAGTVYFYRMSGVGTLETEQPEGIAPNGDLIIIETDGNIHVTQLYYLAVTKTGVDVLQENLNKL